MTKSKLFKWIIGALVLLIIVVFSIYIIRKNYFSASSVGITISGHVYESYNKNGPSGSPAVGAKVLFTCEDDSICKKFDPKYEATVIDNGSFSYVAKNPAPCPYRVIAGSGDADHYNARDYGKVYLKGSGNALNAPNAKKDFTFYVEHEFDLLYSNYVTYSISHKGPHPNGWQGKYHLSQYDEYFLRNPIPASDFLSPIAPTTASFTIPIQFKIPIYNGPGPIDPSALPIKVIFSVKPVFSDWGDYDPNGNNHPQTGPEVGNIKLSMGAGFVASPLKFNVDLSALTPEQKSQTKRNGFVVSMQFDSQGIDPAIVKVWQNFNPDIIIDRSEDSNPVTPVVIISYKNATAVDTSRGGFCTPTVSPVPNKVAMVSDLGKRNGPTSCHRGIDLKAGTGTSIRAVSTGIVEEVNSSNTGDKKGLYIIIKHCNNMYSWYGHLMPGKIKVKKGQFVETNQEIALSDNTGLSTGPHLHFSVAYKGTGFNDSGRYVDPFLDFPYLFSNITASNSKGTDPEKRKTNLKNDSCVKEKKYIVEY